MRHNYATVRQLLADAIRHELLREDGAWPATKAKARKVLSQEISALADAGAYGVLESDRIRVTVVRKR